MMAEAAARIPNTQTALPNQIGDLLLNPTFRSLISLVAYAQIIRFESPDPRSCAWFRTPVFQTLIFPEPDGYDGRRPQIDLRDQLDIDDVKAVPFRIENARDLYLLAFIVAGAILVIEFIGGAAVGNFQEVMA